MCLIEMNQPRTSLTHPLRIDSVALPNGAKLGLSFCPGKKQPNAMTGAWDRDLPTDIRAIRDWGGNMVITMLEPSEMQDLGVTALGQEVATHGMEWLHMPMVNDTVPNRSFMALWHKHREAVHAQLDRGGNVFIHCMGGIGRTSTLAAMILVERGFTPQEAIDRVSMARENSFCMPEQSTFIHTYRPTPLRQNSIGIE